MESFTHKIPERKGAPPGGATHESTYRELDDGAMSIPRGGMPRLRTVLKDVGIPYVVRDERCAGREMSIVHAHPKGPLWDHQVRIVEACGPVENCIGLGETGSGKTSAAIALACRLGRWTLVVVHNNGLKKQWVERLEEECGLRGDEVGIVQGKEKRLRPFTVAMQKTLAIHPLAPAELALFGTVVCDEVQYFAAETFFAAVDPFPARYRFGFSKDERRGDGREYLVYDLFGAVAVRVEREEVVQKGLVHDVQIAVVPTGYEPPAWYLKAIASGNRFRIMWAQNKLKGELAADPKRNAIAADIAARDARKGHTVALLTERLEACRKIAGDLVARGFPPGYMVGGPEHEREFDDARRKAARREITTVVGTIKAFGTGIDVPAFDRGILCSAVGNEQLFGQVRGRFCRTDVGKDGSRLYCLWDRAIKGLKYVEDLARWNDDVVVQDGDGWLPAREFIKKAKAQRAGGLRRKPGC